MKVYGDNGSEGCPWSIIAEVLLEKVLVSEEEIAAVYIFKLAFFHGLKIQGELKHKVDAEVFCEIETEHLIEEALKWMKNKKIIA